MTESIYESTLQTEDKEAVADEKRDRKEFNLDSSQWYLNRELTWLEFNRRVLHEAQDPRTPLLERVKFLAIVSSNLDEFFMKRVGGLKQQVGAGVRRPDCGRQIAGRADRLSAMGRCATSSIARRSWRRSCSAYWRQQDIRIVALAAA